MARAKKDYQRLRLLAREMFVFLGYEQKDIAEELGVNQGTVGKWKREDEWEQVSQTVHSSPYMLLQDYYDLQRAIKEDLMAARESGNKYQGYMDTLLKNHKMVMDMQRILHDPSLVVAINRKFDTWLRQKGVDRQFLDRLVEYQDEYLKELVEERHDPS